MKTNWLQELKEERRRQREKAAYETLVNSKVLHSESLIDNLDDDQTPSRVFTAKKHQLGTLKGTVSVKMNWTDEDLLLMPTGRQEHLIQHCKELMASGDLDSWEMTKDQTKLITTLQLKGKASIVSRLVDLYST